MGLENLLKRMEDEVAAEMGEKIANTVPPMHPRDIAKDLSTTFFAPKAFKPGTIVKCVSQPKGQKFPKRGDLVVVVSQDLKQIGTPPRDGSPQSAGDWGDTMIAIPMSLGGSGEGYGIWYSHSSFFELATEADIEAWEPEHD